MERSFCLLALLAAIWACSIAPTSPSAEPTVPAVPTALGGRAIVIEGSFECGAASLPWARGVDPAQFNERGAVSFAGPEAEEQIFVSPTFDVGAFDECLVSWNARHSPSTGFGVEISVSRSSQGDFSPWMWIGEWNVRERPALLVSNFDDARIDVDTLVARTAWRAIRLRVRVRSSDPQRLRFSLDQLAIVPSLRAVAIKSEPTLRSTPGATPRLPVPFRSQRAEEARLAPRICSPTSLAMVLAYRGVDVPTSEVARRAYDPFHDIYGNWNRAIQAAYSLGVPGRLERIVDWTRAGEFLVQGQPLILSIAAKPGQLRGAPYASTAGHLLVLCGFDGAELALVNDPAASSAAEGRLAYALRDLETVWMARGGTAYVLGPRSDPSPGDTDRRVGTGSH